MLHASYGLQHNSVLSVAVIHTNYQRHWVPWWQAKLTSKVLKNLKSVKERNHMQQKTIVSAIMLTNIEFHCMMIINSLWVWWPFDASHRYTLFDHAHCLLCGKAWCSMHGVTWHNSFPSSATMRCHKATLHLAMATHCHTCVKVSSFMIAELRAYLPPSCKKEWFVTFDEVH